MTSDDEKDPPVPADLVDAAKRIHYKQAPENNDAFDDEAAGDE
ncbi:hypothetical protein [Arthrobacter sp. FW306-05-C]|nr:hypothetical protein [Arthrobacter sp. FW306-05-C]